MAHPHRTRQPATYADLLKVPEHMVAEILDGELHATPRPAPRHADATSGLGGALIDLDLSLLWEDAQAS